LIEKEKAVMWHGQQHYSVLWKNSSRRGDGVTATWVSTISVSQEAENDK
jgi:hypothetical protein